MTYAGQGCADERLEPPAARRWTCGAADRRGSPEKLHKKVGQSAVDAAWKELDNADRYIQFAARVAVEHQDPPLWTEKR